MIPSVIIALPLALLGPIQWIVDLLYSVLLFMHDTIGVGWGTSIVLLTVVVCALLAPLTVKQFKSMQSMVRVAPQLKELQAKYKDDKQRQQHEVMKFYAENKINPFASCPPLVAQMPFIVGLFYLLQTDLRSDICGQTAKACSEVAGLQSGAEKFLFVPDLTDKATGGVPAVLIVLYVGSQLLSTVLTPTTGDRNQRMLMYGLPFVFVLFVINFPAGLSSTGSRQPLDRRSGLHPAQADGPDEPAQGRARLCNGGVGCCRRRLHGGLAAVTGAANADSDGAKRTAKRSFALWLPTSPNWRHCCKSTSLITSANCSVPASSMMT